jgi:hypothetical protein
MMNVKAICILAIVLLLLAMSHRGISQSLNSTGFGLSGNGVGGATAPIVSAAAAATGMAVFGGL